MHTQKLFGPPGTGKTSALLDVLELELSGNVKPERVAFLTFTVAARKEAVRRVTDKFGFTKEQLLYFKTLHSVAFSQLGLVRESMVTANAMREFSSYSGLDFTTPSFDVDGQMIEADFGDRTGDELLTFDHLRRHRQLSMDAALFDVRYDFDPHVVDYFTRAYIDFKDREGLYDFTDLLESVTAPLDVDVVFIDEAQDLSKLQWHVIDVFTANAQRVYIAGDDDQAIFPWAGASPGDFISRAADLTKTLTKSRRVPRRVHDLAVDLSSMIELRQPKEWEGRDEEGELDLIMDVDHWAPRQDGSTLVLYRNHFAAVDVEKRLRDLGVPYRKRGGGVPSAFRWAEAIKSWEALRKGETVTHQEAHAVMDGTLWGGHIGREMKARKVPVTLGDLMTRSERVVNRPWYDFLDRIGPEDSTYLRNVLAQFGNVGLLGEPKIELSTVHAAKGREADHVLMLTAMGKKSYDTLWTKDRDDEIRVMYVGVTRAKKTLTIVGADHPFFNRHLLST